ncbi:MAG: transposase [Bacteroidia bacterium]|nr:transposase [Bacteroidia bacterium]
MSSYRQLLYHLVFRTKDSLPTIKQDHVDQLYAYVSGIIKHKNSHLYRINGVENHLGKRHLKRSTGFFFWSLVLNLMRSFFRKYHIQLLQSCSRFVTTHPRFAPGVIYRWLFQSPCKQKD